MKEQPGVFIRHEACPVCGSNDNRAIYDNGNKFTYFCFGCEDSGVVKEQTTVKQTQTQGNEFMNTRETVQEVSTFPVRGFKERRIKKTIAELYGVKVGYSETDGKTIQFHYYPITNKGKVVGFERREVADKKFTAIG